MSSPTKVKRISDYLNVGLTIFMMFLSGIWFAYSLDRRVSLLEAREVQQEKEISQLKETQSNIFNRLEDKIDKIYDLISRKNK